MNSAMHNSPRWRWTMAACLLGCGPSAAAVDPGDGTSTSTGSANTTAVGDADSASGSGDPAVDTGSDGPDPGPMGTCEGVLLESAALFGRVPRTSLAASQSHLLFVSQAGLEVFDTAASDDKVAELPMIATPRSEIAVDGTVALVVEHDSLALLDIADLTAPSLLGRWTSDAPVLAASSFGERVAVRTRDGVVLLDRTDPARLSVLDAVEAEEACRGLCTASLSASRFFVASEEGAAGAQLAVWDVTDDVLAFGDVEVRSPYEGLITVLADGARALLATVNVAGAQVELWDAAAPGELALLGEADALSPGRTLARVGDIAVSGSNVYDVAGTPTWLGAHEGEIGLGRKVVLDADVATTLPQDPDPDELPRFGVSDPTAPTSLPPFALPRSERAGHRVAWHDDNLIVVADGGSLSVVDVSDRTAPAVVGRLHEPAWDTVHAGGRTWFGVRVATPFYEATLADPMRPVADAGTRLDLIHPHLTFTDTLAVGVDTTVNIVDLTTAPPAPLATIDAVNGNGPAIILGDLLVVPRSGGGRFFDISDPSDPILLVTYNEHSDVAIDPRLGIGDYLLSGRDLLDVSDPEALVVVSTLPPAGELTAQAAEGPRLFEAIVQDPDPRTGEPTGAIVVHDLTDPATPRVAATLPFRGASPEQIDVRNGLVAMPRGELLLGIVDADCYAP